MLVLHAPGPAGPPPSTEALPISEPVVFDTFVGTFQPAGVASGVAVLMLSPFGYEELCARSFWATLADSLAGAGVPSLRFDFPSTGNALDSDADGLEDWHHAAQQAAETLRLRSGASALIVLGQGLGGALALHWAEGLGPLAGLVLLEPVASGRAYLRGLSAWGKSIAAASGYDPSAEASGSHAVAGFGMTDARAAAIRSLNLAQVNATTLPATLLLEQAGGPVTKRLGDRDIGCPALTQHIFDDYQAVLTDPTAAAIPRRALEAVVAWVSQRRDDAAMNVTAPARRGSEPALVGQGFEERPIRFGADRRLAGTLCLPRTADSQGTALVIVSAGRDHSIGWARSAVAQARALAQAGVATLRFDVGGIGDSRATADTPEEILYSPAMCADVRAAVDRLALMGYTSIGLVGRCSGAWAAFTLALEDTRISGVALVNLPYFLWDPSQSLADVINVAQRNLGDLRATLLRRGGVTRLLKGQLSLRNAARILARQFDLRVLRPCAPFLGALTAESRRYHELHKLFAKLRARGMPMLLVYAAGDSSLGELRSFMGQDLRGLTRYPNVTLHEIPDADHNLTPDRARAILQEDLCRFFTRQRQAAPVPNTGQEDALRRPLRRGLVPGQACN